MPYVNEYFSLKESVLAALERKTPQFGYNGYGEFIFYRTYSRLRHNGKQETWSDVVTRVINGVMSIRKDHYIRNRIEWDEDRWQEYAAEMANFMFDMKWLPPGRGLWAMGTPFVVERGSMALFNCFSGATKFRSGDRLFRLDEKVGESVDVECKDGRTRKADICSFGKQKTYCLEFRPERGNYNSKYRFKVECTRNHRWLLNTGEITENIKVGDKIVSKINHLIDTRSEEYKKGYVHGLVFADGTRDRNYQNRFYIRLIGRKKTELDRFVADPRFHLLGQSEGDPRITLLTKENLKTTPDESCSLEYKAGFLGGWLNFDGYDFEHLDTTNEEAGRWLEAYAGILGLTIVGKNINDKPTNYGVRNKSLIRYNLAYDNIEYRLVKITATGREEEVYCAVEPETGTFQIEGGFYTGNCAFTKLGGNDRLANDFHWLMDALMLGVGVGFEALRDDLKVYRPTGTYDVQIPDTREGWCDATRLLIEAYTRPNRSLPVFDYSVIRKMGEKINGFGGQASGPGPLIQLHEDVKRLFTTPGLSPLRLKTDIANKIGCCIISGNVRRSAELAKGSILDGEFMDLKDYDKYPEREDFGWMSNNTVALNTDEDFERLGEVAKRVVTRGEPGIMNLRNFKQARVGRPLNGLREDAGDGLNPCGEIVLEDKELCNISETLPTRCSNDAEWLRACEFACFYSSTVSLLPTHRSETNAVMARNRRIGVGIVDITGWVHETGMHHVIKMMRAGYEIVRSINRLANGEAGVPEAIRVTTVKPGGTIPKVAGKTSGAGNPTFEETLFNTRVAANAPIVPLLKAAGIPYEPEVFNPEGTLVFKWPVKQGPALPAEKVSLWQQAALLTMIQREWADNAVSNTLYFKPKWVLSIHDSDEASVKKTLRNVVKSAALKAAYEEVRTTKKRKVIHEDATRKFVLFYEKWPMNGGEDVQLKKYRFDPNHEEDIIEAVLSSIAPLIKSCSLLPHAAKGVYRQMPQEGITPEEYKKYTADLGRINWEDFTGVEAPDGESEKYCSGDGCVVRYS